MNVNVMQKRISDPGLISFFAYWREIVFSDTLWSKSSQADIRNPLRYLLITE